MSAMTDAAKTIRNTVRELLAQVAAIRATVQGISGGRVMVRRLGATVDDAEGYARLVVPRAYLPGDDVLLLPLGGEPVVLGRLQRSTPGKPTAVTGAAAGSGASVDVAGSDDGFRLVLITGSSGLAAGTLLTVTFNRPRASSEYAIGFNGGDRDSAAATAIVWPDYLSRTATGFTISGDAALPANTSHIWFVLIGEAAL